MKEKMKYRMRRLLSGVLSVMILFSSVPAYAASVGSNADDPSVGYDPSTGSSTVYEETDRDSSNTNVFLTVDDSNVVVGVPTTVILSGTPNDSGQYIGEYSVNVSGDISGDEQLVVEPKEASVAMKQAGKEDKTAVVSQVQTSFTAEDLANNAQTTGAVTATGLTAGSWTADSTFVINAVSRYFLYSSLELAAADSNALTTDNADVMRGDLEHAVAGLYIQDDNAYIRMFKDESDIQGVTFSNDTELNLNGCTLEFADDVMTCMTFEKQYVVYDGAINKTDIGTVISDNQSYFDGNCSISNVDVNLNKTSVSTGNMVGFDLSANQVMMNDFNITATGDGNAQNVVAAGATRNSNGTYTVTDSTWNLTAPAGYIYGLQAKGNVVLNNDDVFIRNNTPGVGSYVYLVRSLGSNMVVDDVVADLANESVSENGVFCGQTNGFTLYAENLESNVSSSELLINSIDLDIVGNSLQSNVYTGTGIDIYAGSSVVINGTEETTSIKCFGNNAISAHAGANLTINGGYFASPAHGAFYATTGSTGSLEINGGLFVNNYSEYTTDNYGFGTEMLDAIGMRPYGACYIGAADGTTDQIVNIRNATFLNMNESFYCETRAETNKTGSGNEYGRGINLTTNFGFTRIAELNLYDCVIKSRYHFLRIADAATVVNFYGDQTELDGAITQTGRLAVFGPNGQLADVDSGMYNDYTGLGLFENQLAGIRFVDGSKVVGSAEYVWTRWHGDWRFLELTIPDGIEWINYHAFYNCSYITTLTIPDSVTKISDGAFANCGWLRTVNIPDELLIQLGNDGRIDDVFSGSPCVDTLTEQYNNLVAQD